MAVLDVRRAHFGAADWLVALLVTLGVSEFLLLGPTESRSGWGDDEVRLARLGM